MNVDAMEAIEMCSRRMGSAIQDDQDVKRALDLVCACVCARVGVCIIVFQAGNAATQLESAEEKLQRDMDNPALADHDKSARLALSMDAHETSSIMGLKESELIRDRLEV